MGVNYIKDDDEIKSRKILSAHPVCASACVFAFIGGYSNSVDRGAKLGIRQISSNQLVKLEDGQTVISLMQNYVKEMLGSDILVDMMIRISSSSIYWLTEKDLERTGIKNITIYED